MAASSTSAPGQQPDPQPQQWTVIEHGGYSYPPGLSLKLLFYLRRRFFKSSNPILLFENLAATYGRIAHYKLGWQHIVFINHPDFIREVLINHPQEMIKERTQRRMKILLGEGLITSEGAFHMRQRRIAAPAFHRQRIAAYADVMTERAALRRAGWHAGQTIDIGAEMMQLALEIVARTLFNTDVTSDVLETHPAVTIIMDL
jgi:cytochrome P450